MCRSLCGVIPSGSGCSAALLDEPVRVGHRRRRRRPGGGCGGSAALPVRGDEHRVVGAGPRAGGLVLGQDLPQQRQHVDLAHAGIGLVATDLEPPVREVDVAPQHRPGRRRSPAAEQQRGDRRAPAGRLDRLALRPVRPWRSLTSITASPRSSSPAASSRIAICSALSRCTGRGFETFIRRRLPTAGLLGEVAVVDGDREDLRQQVDVHVDRARRQRPRAPAVAAAEAVDVRDRHRLAALGGRRDLGRLADLALAVAVDLGDRDLREVVVA